ncbi:flagella synthesis protein FlgN [Colwellia chukchiensis]|uniref:Flagella synthesis protein FlgN n=1 Tax=Colwellia chukchiensis TaxID=641665 RepID=A0A1H7HJ70_9GAMM|nr:flagellar export chaperone FlgN [Colwellia chukchiensis]SEK50446.1 flagella synthesis protein FlgN [Colwellia chukchiensis]
MSDKLTPEQMVAQQLSQLTQLEALLNTEKEILVQQNPEALLQLTQEKNNLLMAIQDVDNVIGQSFEFKQARLAGNFNEQMSEIDACLSRCKKQNELNGLIISQSQLAVERMKTTLLENHNKSSMTYDNKGKTSGGLNSLGIKA